MIDVTSALLRAHEKELKKAEHIFIKDEEGKNKKIFLSPQKKNTRTMWSHWVREGLLKSSQVIWAFTYIKKQRVWLGFSVSSGRRPPTVINLQTKDGRKELVELENKTRTFFDRKREHTRAQEALNNGQCPRCASLLYHNIDRETGDLEVCCTRCNWSRIE